MRSYKKFSMTVLSVLLIILTVFTLPLQVAASTVATADEASSVTEDVTTFSEATEDEARIIGEDKSKRDEYTKYFITDAGTTIVAQYAVPVHYKNGQGEFVEYDNSLTTQLVSSTTDEASSDEVYALTLADTGETESVEEALVNKKSDKKVSHFKKSGKATLIEITRDNHTISWGYSGANIVDAKEQERKSKELTGNDAYLSLQNLSSTVLYENIYNNIDLEVINSTAGVKENIILKASNVKNVFNIEYSVGDLTAESKDSRTIELKDSTGEVVYTITAPYMMDANGETSEALELKILKNNKGKLSVKLTADKAWLKDSSRAYPVTIDPSFEYGQDWGNLNSTYISAHAPNTNFGGIGSLYVGRPEDDGDIDYIRRSLVKIPELPTLNTGDMVVGAYLSLWQSYNSPSIDMQVGLYEAADSWTQGGVTWNNQPGYSSTLIDYEVCEAYTYGWGNWDITELVKGWYNGETNNGFYLVMMNEANVYQGIRFISSSFPSDDEYKPALIVEYRNNKGLENYWDYTSISAGTAGTAFINDYSGNLVFQTSIANTASPKYPANLVYTYNSYMADADYNFYTSYAGKGWKMNYQATVLDSSVFGLEGESQQKYPSVYTDADGTDHYFQTITDPNSENYQKELDEDGLNLELVPVNSTVKAIVDEDKNSIYFDGSGKITHMADSSDNMVELTYSSNDFISEITDADDNVITIQDSNNDNLIDSVCDPSDRATYMNYNSSDYLTSITRPDGTTASFTYDSDGLLTRVTDIDGTYLTFTYSTTGSKGVTCVQEFAADGTPGQKITFDRTKYNTTVMQSAGTDCDFDTSDDIITVYQYDNFGRATSVQSKTKAGEDLGAASATYTSGSVNSDGSNIKTLNRVSSDYSLGANKENLIYDHNMEKPLTATDCKWGYKAWGSASVTGSMTANTAADYILYGKQSLLLNVSAASDNSRGRIYQVVEGEYFEKGATYTLSCYVKTTDLVPFTGADPYGAVICASLFNTDKSSTNYYSDYISTNTNDDINKGFRRLSVTFTVPDSDEFSYFQVNLALRSATGNVYFDGIQLEKSDAASNYNLLENASLERYADDGGGVPESWTGSNLTISNTSDTSTTNAKVDGNTSFRIHGEVDTQKNLYQDVPVNSTSSEKDTYILSGWATADAVPKETNSSCFRILARVYFTDNTYKNNNIFFNTTLENGTWQYASGAFTLSDGTDTDKVPSFIRVYLTYDKQGNFAYFDNLMLTKEAVPSYTYNDEGDLVSVVANAEQNSTYEYADNRLTKYTDPNGGEYTYTYYDETKLLKTATTQKGATYTYIYDDFGNEISVVGTASDLPSLKSEMSYTYPTSDSSTYTITASDQRGETYSETYDCEKGTLLSTTDSKNVSTTYTYDDDNDRKQSISRGDQSVEYTYDDFGKLTGISHEGTSYSFGYDKFNNRTTTAVGNRVLSTNTYDSNNGNLLQMTYGNGDYVSYTYNRFGDPETISYDGTEVVRNFTDSAGNVIRTQDYLTNLEHRVSYDSTGRPLSKEVLDLSVGIGTSNDRWLRSLEYNFDLNNNLTHFAYADSQGSNVVTYAYGADNLLSKTTLDNGKEITYEYDTYGRMTSKVLALDATDADNNLTHSYTFMQSERGEGYTTTLVETETIGNTTYKYTYDSYGNIEDIYLVNSDGTTSRLVSYTYDDYNQLATVNDKVTNTLTSYTYDESGNIIREYVRNLHPSYGYPIGVQSDVSYTYGDSQWKDLLTAYNGQTITYDAIGNPLTYRDGITMTWQNGRELASYFDDANDITYTYDVSGMRTAKDIAGLGEVCYVYEGGLLLQMDYLDYFYSFSYDANGTPIGFKFTTPSGADSYYYYGLNSRGDIIAVYDSQGAKVATYSYDAYGKPVATNILNTNHTFAINNNPLRYRGYVYDRETGLYYLQSRYYDPTTCRFINADDIDYLGADGSPLSYNLFAYCENNPILGYDPYGTFNFWGFLKGVGRVVSGVAAVVAGAAVCIASAPAAITAVAVVTIATGVLTSVNGSADIQQSVTGKNFVRDTVFNGNQKAYDVYSGVTETTAAIGTAICGNYLSTNCTMKGAVPGTETKVTLEPGTTLDRYGSQHGRYLTDPGTSIHQLALTPGNSCKITTYVVNRPFTFRTGVVAPCAWGPGGGVQYFSWMSVQRLVQFGFLTPIG